MAEAARAAIISAGKDKNLSGDSLSSAVLSGDLERVSRMLIAGVAVDSLDSDGFTPVQRCVAVNNHGLLSLFLQKGASAQLSDAHGDSPLHFVAYTGHLASGRLLLEHGANPFVANTQGKTVVTAAAEAGNWALLLLINRLVGGVTVAVPPEHVATAEARLAACGLVGVAGMNAVAIKAPEPLALLLPNGKSSIANAGKGFLKLFSTKAAPSGAPGTTVMQTDGNGLPPPAIVSNLDFSRGIVIYGPLQKKRANKVLSWRPKFYVASALYGALFFWTGTKSEIDGLIKKVRFETFYSVKHLPDKKGGRRFNLKVVSGRTMNLAANTPEEALEWVKTIKSLAGRLMAAACIQALWRGHRVRARARKDKLRMGSALAAVTGSASPRAEKSGGKDVTKKSAKAGISGWVNKRVFGSPTGSDGGGGGSSSKGGGGKGGAASPSPSTPAKDEEEEDEEQAAGALPSEGVVMEGELRKQNHSVLTSLFSSFRTRYFVVHRTVGAIVYYETKAKRTLGVKARRIPFSRLWTIRKSDKDPKSFSLKLTSGKVFTFEARSPEEAGEWVKAIRSVFVRDHLAALKIQTSWRGFQGRKEATAARGGTPFKSMASRRTSARLNSLSSGGGGSSRVSLGAGAGAGAAAAVAGMLSTPPPPPPFTGKKERWLEKKDASGKSYFANLDTGATSWEYPPTIAQGRAKLVPGPYFSSIDAASGKKYYSHVVTNVTTWEKPAGHVSDDEEEASAALAPISTTTTTTTAATKTAAASASASASAGAAISSPTPATPGGASKAAPGSASTAALGRAPVVKVAVKDVPSALRTPRRSVANTRCGAYLSAVRERVEWVSGGGVGVGVYGGESVPSGWCEVRCERSGRVMYCHGATGTSTYSLPSGEETFSPSGEGDGLSSANAGQRLPHTSKYTLPGAATPSHAGLPNPRTADPDEQLTLTMWVNSVTGMELDCGGGVQESGAAPALVVACTSGVLLTTMLNSVVPGGALASTALLPPSGVTPSGIVVAQDSKAARVLNCYTLLSAACAAGIPLPRYATAEAMEGGMAAVVLDTLWAFASAKFVGGGVRALLGIEAGGDGSLSTSSSSTTTIPPAMGLLTESEGKDSVAALSTLSPPTALLLRWVAGCVRSWRSKSGVTTPLSSRIEGLGAAWASGEILCALIQGVAMALPSDIAATVAPFLPSIPSDGDAVEAMGAATALESALGISFALGVPAMFTVGAFAEGNGRLQELWLGAFVSALPSETLRCAGGGPMGSVPLSPFLATGVTSPSPSAGLAFSPPSLPLHQDTPPCLGVGGEGIKVTAPPPNSPPPPEKPTPSSLFSDTRLVRAWVTSLGLQGLTLPTHTSPRALTRAASDGVLILRLLDAVEPGSVQWGVGGGVQLHPTTATHARTNAETAIAIARALELPGSGKLTPGDITGGANVTGVLALLLSCARAHTLGRLSAGAFNGVACDEVAVVAWANERVAAAVSAATGTPPSPSKPFFSHFSALAVGKPGGAVNLAFLLAGLGAAIDWPIVGDAGKAPLEVAAYLVGVAARLGGYILPTPAELVEGAPRPTAFLILSTFAAVTWGQTHTA